MRFAIRRSVRHPEVGVRQRGASTHINRCVREDSDRAVWSISWLCRHGAFGWKRWPKLAKYLPALGIVLAVAGPTSAQSRSQQGLYVWEKYDARISSSETIAPLGEDLFGDRIGMAKGGLAFQITDLALSGNPDLPVEITRKYLVQDRLWRGTTGMLADWDLDLPSLSGTFNPNWMLQLNRLTPPTTNRCSGAGGPPLSGNFTESDFHNGIALNLPGYETGQAMRARTPVTLADGQAYTWVSGSGKVRISCIPKIKNGGGEGFVAVTSDGTRYWFDWMAQTPEPSILGYQYTPGSSVPPVEFGMALKVNTLYATRVEDRFGNSTRFTYTNAWNQPGRLTQIASSDGRRIDLQYAGGFISNITAGRRTWSYRYAATPSRRSTLTMVTLPDGNSWKINLYGLTHEGEIKYRDASMDGELIRDCIMHVALPINWDKTFSGTITHPSGAVGTFVMDLQLHGRSNVPISCRNVHSFPNKPLGAGNDPNDDINLWATKNYSFTLIRKTISGPGMMPMEWRYTYKPGYSIYMYPGTTHTYPVCDWKKYNCSMPPCLADDCAGSSRTVVIGPAGDWTRYTYGNSFRYNEGKLLKVERGASEQNIMEVERYHYDLSLEDGVYPAFFGEGHLEGGQFDEVYHRPLVSRELFRDSMQFIYHVNEFDGHARPVKVTRASKPAP